MHAAHTSYLEDPNAPGVHLVEDEFGRAPPRDGPRERLARLGIEALADTELVALVLGTGRRGESVFVLAERLLADAGGIEGLSARGVGSLASWAGLGHTKAARLVAAFEIGRRVMARPLVPRRAVRSSADVDAALRPRLASQTTERFVALALDTKRRLIAELPLGLGGLDRCPVAPADVFRALLREAAAATVLVHNHPSGEPRPSPDDICFTARLVAAGELLGVEVLDHVVIGAEGYFSFLDHGLLTTRQS